MLAFENYDAIGAYRTEDQGVAVDPSGSLLGENSFEDAEELMSLLSQNEKVGPCITQKLLIYALGRGLFEEEQCLVEHIAALAGEADFLLVNLIETIVQNPLFRERLNTERAISEERDP